MQGSRPGANPVAEGRPPPRAPSRSEHPLVTVAIAPAPTCGAPCPMDHPGRDRRRRPRTRRQEGPCSRSPVSSAPLTASGHYGWPPPGRVRAWHLRRRRLRRTVGVVGHRLSTWASRRAVHATAQRRPSISRRTRASRSASRGGHHRKGARVVAPGSTERRLLVEDDHGASGGTPILSSPIAWRRASAARRPLTGRACPDGRPGGEGFARPRSGRSRDVRPWPPVCARFRPRLRSSARARTARSRVALSPTPTPAIALLAALWSRAGSSHA
jgi:hypothetical protein